MESRRCIILWDAGNLISRFETIESQTFKVGSTTCTISSPMLVLGRTPINRLSLRRPENSETRSIKYVLQFGQNISQKGLCTSFFIFDKEKNISLLDQETQAETGFCRFGEIAFDYNNNDDYYYYSGNVIKNSEDCRLVIGCEIIIFPRNSPVMQNPSTNFVDLWNLYLKGESTDVEVKVGSEIIRCHKDVLTARSSYFEAAFRNPTMLESENCVKIDDFSYQCVKKLIDYCYKSSFDENVEISVNLVCELISLASYLGIGHLVREFEMFILKNIDDSNLFKVLEMAWRGNNEVLLKACAFIFSQDPKLVDNEEYKRIMEQNPGLVIELDNLKVAMANQNPVVLCDTEFPIK